MLRSTQPRNKASRPFICWKCLSQFHSGQAENARQTIGARLHRRTSPKHKNGVPGLSRSSNRGFIAYPARSATVEHISSDPPAHQDPPPINDQQLRLGVIKRLRWWEAVHASTLGPPPELNDYAAPGEIVNSLTRLGGSDDSVVDPDGDMNEDLNIMVFSKDDMLDIGDSRQFLRAGDLVEFQSRGGQDRELAICMGEIEDQIQFYTMTGCWFQSARRMSSFTVHGFVQPEMLDALRPYLPTSNVPSSMQNKIHKIFQEVPRSVGQPLIRKMLDFLAQADATYLENALRLDDAHAHVAYRKRRRYATLNEIASLVLPKTTPKTEEGKFPYPVLFAVHRSILSSVGFDVPLSDKIRPGFRYEICPRNEVSNIELVRDLVREYTEYEFASRSGTVTNQPNRLRSFIAKARRRIDLSRKTRLFTPYGTLSPSTELKHLDNFKPSQKGLEFGSLDMCIIRFLESWTALQSFNRNSPLNGIGSAILRAVDRYHEETVLDRATGWTFLQEVGAIPPWENRAAYDMRAPHTGLWLSGEPVGASVGFIADKLQNIRQDWGDLPIYCIDARDTRQIDDGISIEATDTPDQYWVHIHTADPGAHMDPKSALAQYAEALSQTLYLPGQLVTMLPSDFVQTNLSLAPNRPCLTYSAKINTNGDMLEYKVTPGIVRNVQYMTPSLLGETILGPAFSKQTCVHLVGQESSPPSNRHMLESHELSEIDKENLRLLHVISHARGELRRAKGAVFDHYRHSSVWVSFDGLPPIADPKHGAAVSYPGDPSIRVVLDVPEDSVPVSPEVFFFDPVERLMAVAGEIAARWCSDRGIPVVNLVTARNEGVAEPAKFLAENVLPTMDERGQVDRIQRSAYMQLLGRPHPSSTPGPLVSRGLDMFAPCTNPLRRYSDLLLQWQIESAMLEEARLGKSLVGNSSDDFLPFTRAQIDDIIPRLFTRYGVLSGGNRRASKHWLCLFLLRAWKFGEAEIPPTFPFYVRRVFLSPKQITGMESTFNVGGYCEYPEWPGAQFQPGDIFEVELAHIDIYGSRIGFRALRRLDALQAEVLERENLSMMKVIDVR